MPRSTPQPHERRHGVHLAAMVPDLTQVSTIYQRSLRTVKIRIHRDYAASSDVELVTVTGAGDVYQVLHALFSALDDDQEHFLLLVLNQAHEITGYKLLSSGAQNRVTVDSKIVFRNALLLGAQQVILAHNHPSGGLGPSEADRALTRKLAQAGRLLDIEVLDHIIYTTRGYTSLQDQEPALFLG